MARAHAEREGVTMKNILVALDGSEPATRALAMGADLALRYGATLHLVHVAPRPMVVSEGLKEFARAERVDLPVAVEMSAEGQSLVAAGQATAIAKGVHAPKTSVLTGDPAERLLEYAREQAVDLVVVGRRGIGQIRGLLMGSVSWKVNSLAECPVLTVR
jgi:nucleotide-binding universal stress UspA family protein